MDILLSYGKDERSKVRWSGTSALTVVVQSTQKTSEEEKENTLASSDEESSKLNKKNRRPPRDPEELGLIHVANAGPDLTLWKIAI